MAMPPLPGQNPANQRQVKVTDQTRISATAPVQTLAVPEIPGYKMYWFADRPGRIAWALRVGYEFVTPEEVMLNNRGIGDDVTLDGNQDLGTRVSVHGGEAERGGSERLYLMKIKEAWWLKDREVQAAATKATVAALKRGTIGAEQEAPGDASKRYVRTPKNIFSKF